MNTEIDTLNEETLLLQTPPNPVVPETEPDTALPATPEIYTEMAPEPMPATPTLQVPAAQEIPPPPQIPAAEEQAPSLVEPTAPAQPDLRVAVEPPPQALAAEAPSLRAAEEPKSEPTEEEKVSLYWRDILTGDADSVPDTIRTAAGATEPGLTPEERDYRIYSTVNRSWLVEHKKLSKEKVRSSWPQLRRELAAELKVSDNEEEIFLALSQQYDEEALRKVANSIYTRAFTAGLHDEPLSLDEVKAGLLPGNQAAADAVAANALSEGRLLRERWLPVATDLAKAIEFVVTNETEPLNFYSMGTTFPAFYRSVNALSRIRQEHKQVIYYLAVRMLEKKRAENNEESYLARLDRATLRGSKRLLVGMGTALNYARISTIGNIADSFDIGALKDSARAMDKRMQTFHEILNLTEQQIIPLTSDKLSSVGNFFIEAGESLPSAVVACCGLPGLVALMGAGMGESMATARARSPETPLNHQLVAGVCSGTVQAALFASMGKVGGKVLERSINNFMKSSGRGVGAFSWAAFNTAAHTALDGAGMMLAAKGASVADNAAHELASRMAGTSANIDWSEFGDNLLEIEANLHDAATLLPFLLIGAGRVALRHFRRPETLTGDGTPLLNLGIPPEKVSEILSTPNIDVRGALLQEAIMGSHVYSGLDFIPRAMRALRLLNTDYFRGFETVEAVRDFLRLPAETSQVKRPEYGERTIEAIEQTPNHAVERSGYTGAQKGKRYREMLTLWDEWWTRSHIAENNSGVMLGDWQVQHGAEPTRYERSQRYLQEWKKQGNSVPTRMHRNGLYAPYAEQERAALMRDRVADLQDLSYQLLMNVNPFDSLMLKDISVDKIRHSGELTRNHFLGMVGASLVRAGMGIPISQNMEELSKNFQNYYINKKYTRNKIDVKWLKTVPLNYLRQMELTAPLYEKLEFEAIPELQEAYRIYLGARTNAELLIKLLPQMDDFQTALSRGMSLPEAYAYMAERELGYDPSKLKNYPPSDPELYVNMTPMPEYSQHNTQRCETYMQLTGCRLESETGDDGITYWRLRRPDGKYSRWHESPEYATNDVAANVDLLFLPMGENVYDYWDKQARYSDPDLSQLASVSPKTFTAYDYLCAVAMRELSAHWVESAPYLQPGFFPSRSRSKEHMWQGTKKLSFYQPKGAEPFLADLFTPITPVSMAAERFFVYWQRMLRSGVVSTQRLVDFLNSMEGDWTKELRDLPESAAPELVETETARAMSNFTQTWFLVNLPELEVPQSVKQWFAYSAFCPDAPLQEYPYNGLQLPNKKTLLQWSNRYMAQHLRSMLPQINEVRSFLENAPLEDAHIDRLLYGAVGMDRACNEEQAWCFRLCGEPPIHQVGQEFWNMLQSPTLAWEHFSPFQRQAFSNYLQQFFRDHALPDNAEASDRVYAELQNLESVLSEYPELHALSLRQIQNGYVLQLELPGLQNTDPMDFATPLKLKKSGYTPLPAEDVGNLRKVPVDSIPALANPAAYHALQFLDVVRSYPATLAYTSNGHVYLQNKRYGGEDGLHPAGLESFTATQPLAEVKRLLDEVHHLCAEKGTDRITVRGVSLPDLEPELWNAPLLSGVTVYRKTENLGVTQYASALSRLMPGDAMGLHTAERTPYVVDVRHGIYMGDRTALLQPNQHELSLIPLSSYRYGPPRIFKEANVLKLRMEKVRMALDDLCNLPEHAEQFMDNRSCAHAGMAETVMRLFEDSNFSAGVLRGKTLHELTGPELRTLGFAADVVACLLAPFPSSSAGAKRAFSNLKEAMKKLQCAPVYRDVIEHILSRGSDMLRDKITPRPYQGPIHRHDQ